MMGMEMSKLTSPGRLCTHLDEHYGNMVTYSTHPQPPAHSSEPRK